MKNFNAPGLRAFGVLVLVAVLSTAVAVGAQDPLRVAIVAPSSIRDLSWSQSIHSSLTALQEEMGGESVLHIAYSEAMSSVSAASETLRGYAEDGFDIIIAHGTQYGTSIFDMAHEFPNTSFAWGTATDTGAERGINNVYAYQAAAEEGGYVNGVMAALLTETNVIGAIGPIPAGDVRLYIGGFTQGVKSTNPDAEVLVVYVGSFSDIAAGTTNGRTLLAAGADVLTGTSQVVVGAIEAVRSAGGYWFSTQSDQGDVWPGTVVSSQVYNWMPMLRDIIERFQNGQFGGIAYKLTLANDGLRIAFGTVDISSEMLMAASQAVEDIIDGTVEISS